MGSSAEADHGLVANYVNLSSVPMKGKPDEDFNAYTQPENDENTGRSSKSTSNGFGRQLFAALAANMSAAALGTVLAWTATALPDLRKTTKFTFTTGQENWIGPIALLGAVISCPITGSLIDVIGRRATLLYLNGPFLLGYGLMAFAQNIEMIYAGRFITGFCGGVFSIAAPAFITEVSSPRIRGGLTSGFDMMITVGMLYIFLVGSFVSWEVQALACGSVAVICHLLMLFVPESPIVLAQKGKMKEAREALIWFHGESKSQKSSDKLQAGIIELQKITEQKERVESNSGWSFLISGSVLKPMGIGVALMFFQQLSGVDPILFYIIDIFSSAGTNINENVSTIIVGVVQVLATVVAALVVDRSGRIFLLLVSDIFMVISLFGLGIFFYMQKHPGIEVLHQLSWLPLTSLMVYVVAFSVGFGPIPWLLINEIAPIQAKGTVSGVVTITRWLLGFIISLVFKNIMNTFGNDGGYWFFAAFCFLGTIFVYFLVPETKGKTLEEIQQYFNPSNEFKEKQQFVDICDDVRVSRRDNDRRNSQ